MFGWKKRASALAKPSIRETLFGDLPLSQWPPISAPDAQVEPWKHFVATRAALENGDEAGASAQWRRVLAQPNLEARHVLQAWYFRRERGEFPLGNDSCLLGVVVEFGMPHGRARYFNFGGAARLNMLTLGGLYFRQAALEVLSREPMAAPLFPPPPR